MRMRPGPRVAVTLAAIGLFGIAPLQAHAPMVKTQGPGYYRMMLGEVEITALLDGTASMPIKEFLTGITPAEADHDLAHAFMKDPMELSINAFLVNTGTKLVLIDSGDGGHMDPGTGHLIENLKAAGYEPAQVDEIYITHMHGDHIDGAVHVARPALVHEPDLAFTRTFGSGLPLSTRGSTKTPLLCRALATPATALTAPSDLALVTG